MGVSEMLISPHFRLGSMVRDAMESRLWYNIDLPSGGCVRSRYCFISLSTASFTHSTLAYTVPLGPSVENACIDIVIVWCM
jgi:hypothetical protein